MKQPTWYPNADENKCAGSFQIAIYQPKGGKVECAVCGREVGMRNPRTRQIAMHRNVLQGHVPRVTPEETKLMDAR